MPKLSQDRWNDKQQQIIESAKNLFAQKGYLKVSVNDIIKEARISKGGFYVYFKSKQEIFFEILKDSDYIRASTGKDLPKDMAASQKIRQYIKIRLNSLYKEETKKWVKYASEFWSTVVDDEQLDAFRSYRANEFLNDIESILKEGIDQDEFSKSLEIKEISYLILSMIDGFAFMVSVMKQPITQETVELTINIIVGYLNAKQ